MHVFTSCAIKKPPWLIGPRHPREQNERVSCFSWDMINVEELYIPFVFRGWLVIKVFTKTEDVLQQQINAGLYLDVLQS